MNTGSPPTAPNARTGEFTPPGMTSQARPYRLRGVPDPVCAGPAAGAGGGHHIAVPAVPAQPGHGGEAVRLTVQVTRPPFVLVGGRAPGGRREEGPVGRAP